MHSLVLSLVGIALAAALALVTASYVADIGTMRLAQSRALSIENQARQLLAAAQLFRVQESRWPTSVAELVERDYLRMLPASPSAAPGLQGASTEPLAAASLRPASSAEPALAEGWLMRVYDHPVFELQTVSALDACRRLNLSMRGDDGVLQGLVADASVQCVAASDGSLRIVASSGGAGAFAAYAQEHGYAFFERAADAQAGAWLQAPVVTTPESQLSPLSPEGYRCFNPRANRMDAQGTVLDAGVSPGGYPFVVMGPVPQYFSTLSEVKLAGTPLRVGRFDYFLHPSLPVAALTVWAFGDVALSPGSTVSLEVTGQQGLTVTCRYRVD